MLSIAAFGIGIVVWSFTEFAAHGWLMHGRNGKGPASHEHLMHHASPERSRTWLRILGHFSMYATSTAIGFVVALFTSVPVGVGFGLGWAAGYTYYELWHWLAHHRPPRNARDRMLRKRHFRHHFGGPRTNLGVITPAWDALFRTESASTGPVRVPRRLAMPWLVDEAGRLLPDYEADYLIVGRLPQTEAQLALDIEAAFSDRPLALD